MSVRREHLELLVPDHDQIFVAIAAGNYYDADLAFWTLKAAIGSRKPTTAEHAHLTHLQQRCKETYAQLVAWTMTAEASRVGSSERNPE